jgi:hypothetical protein
MGGRQHVNSNSSKFSARSNSNGNSGEAYHIAEDGTTRAVNSCSSSNMLHI